MLDIQQKRKLRSVIYHKFTLGVIFLVVLWVVHSTWVVYKKKVESEDLMRLSIERVESLRNRNDDLDYKISRLDTEVGIEEEIRSKFSVTKEDENMVVVVAKEDKISTTTVEKSGFWEKFKKFFR